MKSLIYSKAIYIALSMTCLCTLFSACSISSNSEKLTEVHSESLLEQHIKGIQKEQHSDFQALISQLKNTKATSSNSSFSQSRSKTPQEYEMEPINLPDNVLPVAFNNNGSLAGSLSGGSGEIFFWNKDYGFINVNDWIEARYETERDLYLYFRSSMLNNEDEIGGSISLSIPGDPIRAPYIWHPENGLTIIDELKASTDDVFSDLIEINAINDNSELFGHQYGGHEVIRRALYVNQDDSLISDASWPAMRVFHANNNRLAAGYSREDFSTSPKNTLLNMNTNQTTLLDDYDSSIISFDPRKVTNSNKVLAQIWLPNDNDDYYGNDYGYLDEDGIVFYEVPEGAYDYYLNSINNEGEAVGYAFYENGFAGIKWNPDGSYEIPEFPEPTPLFFINDEEQMVGAKVLDNGALAWQLITPNDGEDTTPPDITFEQQTESLWPPNHHLELVLSGISASDNTDPNPLVEIEISSSELLNGKGDGHTETDWEVAHEADGSFSVYLRAERSGNETSRTYTVLITATDEAGNQSQQNVSVNVAHDRSAFARSK